jgi:hypothetical protein
MVCGMRIVELATWVAAGLAVAGVALAAWQLRKAYQRARQAEQYAGRVQVLAEKTDQQAARAEREALQASSQARWAWEQVKLASRQLEQARSEHRASSEAEYWEWSYALTTSAREAVDASNELIRITIDSQAAPHYRTAAERHYEQTATRWHETMTKALARTEPTLELQQQILTFTRVQHRLHGHIGVLLRAAETGTLAEGDRLSKQAIASGQELESVRRHLQRTVNDSLVGAHLDGAQPTIQGPVPDRMRQLETTRVTEPGRRQGHAAAPTVVHGSLGRPGPGRDVPSTSPVAAPTAYFPQAKKLPG